MARLVHRQLDIEYRRAFRREHVLRDRSDHLEEFDDLEMYERFRFGRRKLTYLITILRDSLEYSLRKNHCLSPVLQVCTALRYFSSGCFQIQAGDLVYVHKFTASSAVWRVVNALNRIFHIHVFFPQDQRKLEQMKVDFYELGANDLGFPGVIGCIDGTQIRTQSPPNNEWEYVNREGFHAITIQLVWDVSLKIMRL